MAARRNPSERELARRQDRWDKRVGGRLAEMLKQLLDSKAFGLTNGRPLPPKGHGVYLLSEDGEPGTWDGPA